MLAATSVAQITPYEVIKFQHPSFGEYQDVQDLLQDPRGFIWIATRDRGVFRYDGYDMIPYRNRSNNGRSISSDLVNTLHLSESGDTLWIGTAGGTYQYLDLKRERVYPIERPANSERATWINDISVDDMGNQWLSTEVGLWYYQRQQRSWEHVTSTANDDPVTLIEFAHHDASTMFAGGTGQHIFCIDKSERRTSHIAKASLGIANQEIKSITSHKKELWVGTDDGVYHGDISIDSLLKRVEIPGIDDLSGIDLIFPSSQGLLIGADEGLIVLDDRLQLKYHFPTIKDAQCALVTENDLIWIGTRANGLFKLRPVFKPFNNVNRDIYDNFPNNNIHGLWEDEAGLIWFGTEEGLQILDRINNKLVNLDLFLAKDHLLRKAYIATIQEDHNGVLWIGTRSNGLFRIDKGHSLARLSNVTQHDIDETDIEQRRYNNTAALITEGQEGQIWVASLNSGLHLFSSEGKELLRILHDERKESSLPVNGAAAIYFDSLTQLLYVGTLGGGLTRSNLKNLPNPEFETFSTSSDPHSISSNIILSILQDGDSILWIGTYGGGLNKMDLKSNRFETFSSHNGSFPDDQVWGTIIDNEGFLWASTGDGLVKFDRINHEVVHVFNQSDGLPSDEFTYFSYFKASDGNLFFGGKNGFTYFDPALIRVNDFEPRALITDLGVLNKPVVISDSTLLQQDISYLPDLTFSHRENVFTLTFSSNSFFQPSENQFRYKMEGLDEDWVDVKSNRRYTTYTNLKPGNYTFLVSCSNDDGVWSSQPTSLAITVLPAPWETGWAKLVYLLLFLVIAYLIYRTTVNRLQLKTNLALQEAEAQRLKEINEFKNRFFTNITHEFRTPLTIISGMTKSLQTQSNNSLGKIENMVQKSTGTLLRLVNQMLDLAKVESGVLQTSPRQGNIVVYIRSQLEVFTESAANREISIEFSSDQDEIIMDYDASTISTIIQNLVSNAIKYGGTNSTIKVQTSADQEKFTLRVEDEGKGIKPKDLPHIFDRFYQTADHVQSGSGIGLALVKELIELLHGKVRVDSTYGEGTTFIVTLPITRNAPMLSRPSNNLPSPGSQKMAAKRKGNAPLILIVEDNPDLIYVIRSTLGPEYQILEASDGEVGKQLAIEQIPDLIITDVMMPKINGLEMCRILKQDEKTSHIPIIMLTAKITIEDRVQGLEEGADAYLAKPFNDVELQVRVKNLLKNREKLRARYSLNGLKQDKKNAATTPVQDEFVQRLRSIIEVDLQNEEMSPAYLCDKLFISRTQLHRKISAITGLSTTKFINAIRVEKAQELLISTDKPIEEISYETGFKNPTYFRRVFKEFTQQSASQYRSNH